MTADASACKPLNAADIPDPKRAGEKLNGHHPGAGGPLAQRSPVLHRRQPLSRNPHFRRLRPKPPIVAGAPFSFFVGGDLLILAGMAYDRISRGRIHAVWIRAGGAVVASQIGKVFISQTEPWMAFGRFMADLWPV
jgi:hypothetical protein